jgi:hypothetical protein
MSALQAVRAGQAGTTAPARAARDRTAHQSREAEYPPLMQAQAAALRDYARTYGARWKPMLRAEWLNDTAEPLLHSLRNSHGPFWLAALPPSADGEPG